MPRHQLDPLAVDEVRVRGDARNEQADKVGLAQSLGEIVGHEIEVAAGRHRRARPFPPAADDTHLEPSLRDPRHGLTDAARSDDGEGLAFELDAEERRPFTVAHRAGDRREAARGSRNEEKRQLGHGLIEDRWCVGAQKPSRRRLPLVDPLVTDTEPGDHAATRQGRVKRLAVRLASDDDVPRAGLGNSMDERRLFGRRRHEREARR